MDEINDKEVDVAAKVEHWMAELSAEINRTPYRNPQQFAAVFERAARHVLTRVFRMDGGHGVGGPAPTKD